MLYADYNGSAPLLSVVQEFLIERIKNGPFANPNTIHSLGSKVGKALSKSREVCAASLDCDPSQIIFTSGASEGISTIINSILKKSSKKRILISPIEHSAVLNIIKYYEKEHNFTVDMIPVSAQGVCDQYFIKNYISKNSAELALVCLMAANNETGVIQPWFETNEICKTLGVEFFCDTTQYIGKTNFSFNHSNLDYAVLSGHKVGALIGSGLMIIKNPLLLSPLIFGGGQEFSLRGGTQNYIGAETIAIALHYFNQKIHLLKKQAEERILFETKLKNEYQNLKIIGDSVERLPGTTLVSIIGLHGQAVQIELESKNIFVSTSSACSDNEPVTSRVLKAMKITDDIGRGVIRISLGLDDFSSKYQNIFMGLKASYDKLIKIQSY